MTPIKYECPDFGPIHFMGEKLNEGADRFIRSNCDRETLDLLLFFDSRGVGGTYEGSLAERIIDHVQESQRYLLICRPLELTTWASLINFLILNKLSPPKIVTNMGFVDFTPKKQVILEDAIQQVEAFMGRGVAVSRVVEQYVSSGGEEIPLFAMSYGWDYKHRIEAVAQSHSLTIINSPPLSPEIRLQRERPRAFFANLDEANKFNRSISGARIIDFPVFDETQTYDGVHYTNLGNDLIFRKIKECL
jgi:hypothetical protein